ncbi:CU044_5270 family protein [Streptomyces sp. NPDC047525]|uniref:CU044_5270 family protein n=1 Tax=Streptomyces sp. NPDC047525 TaxID=3155264 RepID=UPI0033F37EA2
MTERGDLLDFPGAEELIAAGDVAPPAPDVAAAARTAVASAALREASVVPLRTRAVPRRRRLLIAAAAVAAIATGAVAYPVLDLGGKPAATASAAQFLNDMATVAADSPAAATSPYWKVRMATVNQDDGDATTTTYFDRAGRIWTVDANGTVHGPGKGSKTKKWSVGGKWLTWPALDKLPTGQKALTALFPRDAESRRHQVTALLEDSPASPELRAALFQILADTPGVKLIGDVRDSKGRPGVAFEIRWSTIGFSTGPGKDVKYRMTDRYIVDPDTGFLLETTHKSHGKGGSADRYTWLEVGPADRVG